MRFLLLLSLLAMAPGLSLAKGSPLKTPPKAALPPVEPDETEKFDVNKIILAIPIGAALGFGLGHLQQERLKGYAYVYTAVDALAWILFLSSFGDCRSPSSCSTAKDNAHKWGLGLLVASRLVQVVDLSVWSLKYYQRFHADLRLHPVRDGAQLTAGLTW